MRFSEKMKNIICHKKEGFVENILVFMVAIVLLMAFLTVTLGAFSSISDKWQMRQAAREYLLLMETEGYLTPADQASLQTELESYGLYNIDFTGTTVTEANYGDRIYLRISGTYDVNVLDTAGAGIGHTTTATPVTINRQSTAKN